MIINSYKGLNHPLAEPGNNRTKIKLSYQHILVYTDGSCNPFHHTGGWAAILLIGNEKVILKGTIIETSHHRMELVAVLNALEYIKDKGLQKNHITIYTDSQYVAGFSHRKEQLKRRKFLTKKGTSIRNPDLVQKLIEDLDGSERLEFIEIPSHGKKLTGPNYNREVDVLSRKEVRNKISMSDDPFQPTLT
jgi:ribonuclease HI